MKKVKKLYSRKRRALRRLALLLAALLACNCIFHFAYLLPIQALRYGEQELGVYGRAEILAARWRFHGRVGNAIPARRIYFTAGERMVQFCGVELTFAGWVPSFGRWLDCSDGEAVHGGRAAFPNRDGTQTDWYFYGRVDVPDADWIELAGTRDGENFLTYAALNGRDDGWFERDGCVYFLAGPENFREAFPGDEIPYLIVQRSGEAVFYPYPDEFFSVTELR